MQKEYKSRYYSHVVRIALIFIIGGVLAVFARGMFVPEKDPEQLGHAHYRASDIPVQKDVEARHQTNESCLECHQYVKKFHMAGVHKTVSCEFCHGPYADHVKDGKYVAKLPVKKDAEITALCLRCHNQIIRARPSESIKMIAMPQHLEEKHVRLDHNCNQCHMVHDPLLWINQSRAMMGLAKKEAK